MTFLIVAFIFFHEALSSWQPAQSQWSGECDASVNFLQIELANVHEAVSKGKNLQPHPADTAGIFMQSHMPEIVPLPSTKAMRFLEKMSNWLVSTIYVLIFLGLCLLFFCGLPSKAPQHESVKEGTHNSAVVVLVASVYGFIYFSTDQYVPSLPRMEVPNFHEIAKSTSLISLNFKSNLQLQIDFFKSA